MSKLNLLCPDGVKHDWYDTLREPIHPTVKFDPEAKPPLEPEPIEYKQHQRCARCGDTRAVPMVS